MKRTICIILSALLMLTLAACGGKEQGAGDFTWTREGYFSDEGSTLLSIQASEDAEHPGWYVGLLSEEGINGWYLQQEGKTLHGSLHEPGTEGAELIATITEEGEDGVQLVIEKGRTYHLTPYEAEEAAFALRASTRGDGEIAYAEGNAEPEFEEGRPYQSAYIGLVEPEVYTFAARPAEGYKFLRWTVNGTEYSKDLKISFEIKEDTELVAVFGIAGTNEEHVDLDSVTTIGQLLGLPDYGISYSGNVFVRAFEQDGDVYRADAELTEEARNALNELDWDDEKYDEKFAAIISGLKVTEITNLSKSIPTQAEMDKLIGKTGKELIDSGWYCFGSNTEDMLFYMSYEGYDYVMGFEGKIPDPYDFKEEDILPLVVTSVEYNGIGDATFIRDEE